MKFNGQSDGKSDVWSKFVNSKTNSDQTSLFDVISFVRRLLSRVFCVLNPRIFSWNTKFDTRPFWIQKFMSNVIFKCHFLRFLVFFLQYFFFCFSLLKWILSHFKWRTDFLSPEIVLKFFKQMYLKSEWIKENCVRNFVEKERRFLVYGF